MTIQASKRDYMRRPQKWMPSLRDEELSLAYIYSKHVHHTMYVDYKDLPKVMVYRWYIKDGYAVTSIKYKRVRMHHLIIGKPTKGTQVDHINRNRLDNRRSNLRLVTSQQNHFNTEFLGVRKRGNKWTAQIQLDKKSKHLGTFDNKKEARNAYLKAKKIHHII